jgi:AraC family transcriptional regulator of adaptative response/methylated-DNA-[protein]-cysteine methyltransferase
MVAAASDTALLLLEFADRRMLEKQIDRIRRQVPARFAPGENQVLAAAQSEIAEYFAGARREFTVPLDTPGSPFQRAVWDALRAIPYGETRSYLEQARAIGRPDAVRAVARANGDNRISIIIPCHRVIGSNGELTGYGGQLWRKKALLERERAAP